MHRYAVTADGLHKRYGATRALDGFDLAVPRATVCALALARYRSLSR